MKRHRKSFFSLDPRNFVVKGLPMVKVVLNLKVRLVLLTSSLLKYTCALVHISDWRGCDVTAEAAAVSAVAAATEGGQWRVDHWGANEDGGGGGEEIGEPGERKRSRREEYLWVESSSFTQWKTLFWPNYNLLECLSVSSVSLCKNTGSIQLLEVERQFLLFT